MVVVAIQSSIYRGKYVTLDASGLTSPAEAGAGTAGVATFVGPYETFQLINNSDGTVSFACTAFKNVYLRADGRGVCCPPGVGVVNAQFGLGPQEKFFLRRPEKSGRNYNGSVGLELAAFPGRFLRLCDSNLHVQGWMRGHEMFEIMVVGAFQSSVV